MQIKLFLYFEFELRIAHSFCQKTVWTGVKFLDGSFFCKIEPEPIFGFPHTLSKKYMPDWASVLIRIYKSTLLIGSVSANYL